MLFFFKQKTAYEMRISDWSSDVCSSDLREEADMAHSTDAHAHHDHKPGFFLRWFCSTNHKDIGTLYLLFAVIAGIIGAFFSLVMRMDLQDPGVQSLLTAGHPDGHLGNVLVPRHGPALIFFVVR